MHSRQGSNHHCAALLATLAVVAADVARAQLPPNGRDIPQHRLAVSFGWDPVWVVGIAYARAVRDVGGHDGSLEVTLHFPPVLLRDLDAWKLSVGATGLFVASRSDLGLAAGAHTSLAATHDATGRKLAWAFDLTLHPGVYGTDGTIALDCGWRQGLATSMHHADAVRDLFAERYGGADSTRIPAQRVAHSGADAAPDAAAAGPHDGWFRFPARRFRLGLAGACRFGGTTGLQAAVGFERTAQKQGIVANPTLGQLPFTLQAGVEGRWDD